MIVLRIAAGGIAMVLLQWLFFSRLRMFGAYPDVVLLYVGWVAIRYGRMAGSIAGATVGLLMDIVLGTWGIHMFLKTLMGFLIGMVPSGQRVGILVLPLRVWMSVLSAALVHNGILVLFIVLQSGVRVSSLLTVVWLGCAFYTSCVGALAANLRRGRSRRG